MERQPLGPLQAKVSLTPYPAIDLSATANWDHYEREMKSGSGSLDLTIERSGGRQDLYRVDLAYAKETTRNLNYEAEINLLFGFSVGVKRKRDLIIKYDIENSYWVDYQSQCWGLRLVYEELEADERVMLFFRLLGVGEAPAFRKSLEE
jgi:hypothetical protein